MLTLPARGGGAPVQCRSVLHVAGGGGYGELRTLATVELAAAPNDSHSRGGGLDTQLRLYLKVDDDRC